MNTNNLAITISTVPTKEDAERIARALVSEKLAACVNIIPELTSIYSWQGKIESNTELLLLIKSPAHLYEKLETRLLELHPYDTPEIVCFEANEVEKKYFDWLMGACR